MKDIHSLVHSLSPLETELVKISLGNRKTARENETKLLRMFDYLLRKEEGAPTLNECSIEFYGHKKDSKIEKVKMRLKNRILDTLLSESSLEKSRLGKDRDLTILKIKKKLAQFVHLNNSVGCSGIAEGILDEIVVLSKKCEYFEGIVEGLILKAHIKGLKKGTREFEENAAEIAFFKQCSEKVKKAIECFSAYAGGENNGVESLCHSIAELKKDYAFSKSVRIRYYLMSLEGLLLFFRQQFYEASRKFLELLVFIRKHKAVFQKRRIGFVIDYLAQCEFYQGNYRSSVEYSRDAQKLLVSGTQEYFLSREHEFYACFHDSQFSAAQAVLDSLSDVGALGAKRQTFYQAALFFS